MKNLQEKLNFLLDKYAAKNGAEISAWTNSAYAETLLI